MELELIELGDIKVVMVNSPEILIRDEASALDLMATINYEAGSSYIILKKENIVEDFFDLSTKLAGEIMQKYIVYGCKLAIIGDYSSYTSKSLKDFIRETNRGQDIFFLTNRQEALEKFKNL